MILCFLIYHNEIRSGTTLRKKSSKKTRSKSKSSRKIKAPQDYKWQIGDCVKPMGMQGQHYIIEIDAGDSWKMVHSSGRYFDLIPKSNENNTGSNKWIKFTC